MELKNKTFNRNSLIPNRTANRTSKEKRRLSHVVFPLDSSRPFKLIINNLIKHSCAMCFRHEVPVTNDPITIVHMDDDIVVVNKPASIPVTGYTTLSKYVYTEHTTGHATAKNLFNNFFFFWKTYLEKDFDFYRSVFSFLFYTRVSVFFLNSIHSGFRKVCTISATRNLIGAEWIKKTSFNVLRLLMDHGTICDYHRYNIFNMTQNFGPYVNTENKKCI